MENKVSLVSFLKPPSRESDSGAIIHAEGTKHRIEEANNHDL